MLKWLVVLCLVGCKGRTELMIGVATDLRAPDALDEAQLLVTRADTGVIVQQVQWDISGNATEPFNLPGSYGVFSDGEEVRIGLELRGLKSGAPRVNRRALLNLIEGETLFFRMTLVSGCVDRTDCAANETCLEGACVDPAIDSRRLPDFTATLVTELSCASGPMYLDTATGDPMPLSPTASMCPGNLCSEGTCQKPIPDEVVPGGDGGGGDGDGGVIPVLPPNRYVIGTQIIPLNNAQATQLGLDLDGDAQVDNQLGMVMATFTSQGLISNNDPVRKGETITLINLGAGDLSNTTPATFATFTGTNPQPPACNGVGDTICGNHLQGTGSFDISPDSPLSAPLVGAIAGGMMTAGPGALSMEFVLHGPVALDLIGARVRIASVSQDGLTSGVIAGGVRGADVDAKLIPAWAQIFEAKSNLDCPGNTPPACGCTSGSEGETILGLFDSAPQDCAIDVNEVRNNSLIQSLISPDLTIDGQPALSLGIGFTAVRGDFAVPVDLP
jgi:hypothetical protein